MLSELKELVQNKIITQNTADDIENYYQQKKEEPSNRLIIIFGVIGALLVGLGINLVIAHNWDNFSNFTKLIFAFMPLIIGQAVSFYSLTKKRGQTAWLEASAIFFFLAIGINIALVSQVYNTGGTLSDFLMFWLILGIPILYVMKSSFVSIIAILLITYYAIVLGYDRNTPPYLYWALLASIIPFYYLQIKNNPTSNSLRFLNWLIPITLIIVWGSFIEHWSIFVFFSYMALLGLFTSFGNLKYFENIKSFRAYRILGALGFITIVAISTFGDVWTDKIEPSNLIETIIVFGAYVLLLFFNNSEKNIRKFNIFEFIFLAYFFISLISTFSLISAVVLSNLLILALGIYNIIYGVKNSKISILNYGLLMISGLIIMRFFDIDMSFITRGLIFVVLGISFFVVNFIIIKKKNKNNL